MAVIDIVAAAAAANSSQGGLVAANNLRIASIAIAAYEYVAGSCLLTVIVTSARSVISLLYLPRFDYTRLQVHVGKKVSPSRE